MKKLLLAAALLASAALSAKPFEGSVKYQITGSDGKAGHVMTMTVKDGKVRTEAEGKGAKGVAIMDMKAKQMTMLMPEQKKYMVHKLDGAAKAKGKGAKGSLKKTGKSATIAGYKADEWAYTDGSKEVSLWGSTELGSFEFGRGSKEQEGEIVIPAELKEKGFFLLKVSSEKAGKEGGMEAIEVKPGSVDASLFEVPAGYTEMKMPSMPPDAMKGMGDAMKNMTPEQRKMMQKMMGGHAN